MRQALYWMNLLFVLVIVAIIGVHFAHMTDERFDESQSLSATAGQTISSAFGVKGEINDAIINGQLSVNGTNNRFNESWLPNAKGHVILRPVKGKNIYIGDKNAKNIILGDVKGDSKLPIHLGKNILLPDKNGNIFINPNSSDKQIAVGTTNTKSIDVGVNNNISSVHVGPHTWLPYSDGNSYIRPGKPNRSIVVGDMWTDNVFVGGNDRNRQTNIYLKGRTYLEDNSGGNNSDPYYLEKVVSGNNMSALRLTINDDEDESFQIWGDSCKTGNCGGPGVMRHFFGANGTARHTGPICMNNTCIDQAQWDKLANAKLKT